MRNLVEQDITLVAFCRVSEDKRKSKNEVRTQLKNLAGG